MHLPIDDLAPLSTALAMFSSPTISSRPGRCSSERFDLSCDSMVNKILLEPRTIRTASSGPQKRFKILGDAQRMRVVVREGHGANVQQGTLMYDAHLAKRKLSLTMSLSSGKCHEYHSRTLMANVLMSLSI